MLSDALSMTSNWIKGRIHLAEVPKDFRGIVRVRLLDTSRADAPSSVVAEEIIREPLARLQGGSDLDFRIPLAEKLPVGISYSLHAHVDCDASGLVKLGDQITVQSYPFTLGDIDRSHELQLKRVE